MFKLEPGQQNLKRYIEHTLIKIGEIVGWLVGGQVTSRLESADWGYRGTLGYFCHAD